MYTLRVKGVLEPSGIVSARLVLTIARQRSYLATGVKVEAAFWNPKGSLEKANWISSKHSAAESLNQHILGVYIGFNTHVSTLVEEGNLTTASEAVRLYKIPVQDTRLLAWVNHFIEEQKERKSADWVEKYSSTVKKLAAYVKNHDKPISAWSHAALDNYRQWLEHEGGYKPATAARHLSFIRTAIHYAVSCKVISVQDNPFLHYRIKSGKQIKEKLKPEELQLVLSAEAASPIQQEALDTWLLQYYFAGMRISDALQIKNSQVQDDYFTYVAQKTGKPLKIPIVPQARLIINKYVSDSTYLLPWLNKPTRAKDFDSHIDSCTASINKQLVALGRNLGLSVRLTTHHARYCFADNARRVSGDLYAISKTLNHSNLNITEKYLSENDNTAVEELVRKIFT